MPSVLSAHLPDDWPLAAKLADRVSKQYGGKASAYVRSVVEKDLRGENALPAAKDGTFVERLFDILLPARSKRFARAWERRHTGIVAKDRDQPTQGEVATGLLEALLDAYERIQVGRPSEAFVVLFPQSWDALLDAANRGDIAGVRQILRANDPSGASVTYGFEDSPALLAAEPAAGEGALARQAAVSLESIADAKESAQNDARPGRAKPRR